MIASNAAALTLKWDIPTQAYAENARYGGKTQRQGLNASISTGTRNTRRKCLTPYLMTFRFAQTPRNLTWSLAMHKFGKTVITPVMINEDLYQTCEECNGPVLAVGYLRPGERKGKLLDLQSTVRTLHEPWCKWQVEITRIALENQR